MAIAETRFNRPSLSPDVQRVLGYTALLFIVGSIIGYAAGLAMGTPVDVETVENARREAAEAAAAAASIDPNVARP